MKKSFAELEQATVVDPHDVIDSLKGYAESGAAINGKVVVDILRRTQFSGEQMKEILAVAQTGV